MDTLKINELGALLQNYEKQFPRRRVWYKVFARDQSHAQRAIAYRGQTSDLVCG